MKRAGRNGGKQQREEEGKRFIITVFGEIGEGVRGALGGGTIGFVPGESGIEEGNLFLNVGEEGVASVAGGRRGDLWVVIEFLLELPLLPFPLREALIWTPLKLHRMDERITRRGRRRRRRVPRRNATPRNPNQKLFRNEVGNKIGSSQMELGI